MSYPASQPIRCVILLLAMAWVTPTLNAQQPDLQAILAKVDQRYDHMHTLEARFEETYSGAGATRTESGTLLLKKPGRMRWNYEQPRPKLFLSDGKTAWFYVPGEQQVRRAPVKQLEDLRSPLRYLLGNAKLGKELENLSLVSGAKPADPGNVVIQGVPQGMEDRVADVQLEISLDGVINRIRIDERDGSTTEFRFLQQKENVQLNDSEFRFTPPPGVEVVEGSELTE